MQHAHSTAKANWYLHSFIRQVAVCICLGLNVLYSVFENRASISRCFFFFFLPFTVFFFFLLKKVTGKYKFELKNTVKYKHGLRKHRKVHSMSPQVTGPCTEDFNGGNIPRVWTVASLHSRASEELQRLECNVLDGYSQPDLIVRLQSSSLDNCDFWKVR